MTWTATPRGYKTIIVIGAPNSAEVFGPQHEANARLIAAAPDLLAAAEAVIDDLEGHIGVAVDHCASTEWLREARARLDNVIAAIAKAKGA